MIFLGLVSIKINSQWWVYCMPRSILTSSQPVCFSSIVPGQMPRPKVRRVRKGSGNAIKLGAKPRFSKGQHGSLTGVWMLFWSHQECWTILIAGVQLSHIPFKSRHDAWVHQIVHEFTFQFDRHTVIYICICIIYMAVKSEVHDASTCSRSCVQHKLYCCRFKHVVNLFESQIEETTLKTGRLWGKLHPSMHFLATTRLIEAFVPRHLSAMVTGRDAIGKVIHRLSVMGMPKVSWLFENRVLCGLEWHASHIYI